jgi:hypothetical protein
VVFDLRLYKIGGYYLFASKNAFAKPGGVIDRNLALSSDGGIK